MTKKIYFDDFYDNQQISKYDDTNDTINDEELSQLHFENKINM